MTSDGNKDMDALDAMMREAAQTRPDLPDGLTARVMADAYAMQAQPRRAVRRSVLAEVLKSLGGWPAVSGLAAATCAGFWIGISPPASLPDAGTLLAGETIPLSEGNPADVSGFGWDFDEG